mmetsp:Transcript_23539/g.42282  ORF Transcript_23539/g.42282 Transcript_23539/m.42282 type:complete len:350 (+) Transcript_23539:128-1177(+)|eukprot:CAMPEP_0201610882 /NCGR_PEP_ID=MMETSP0492-20130828/18251_1 /ASSEMBLY_ACC=CAM_ASM_000837 /TAXON_ID=420259 /ORGANISM="Thalassiosira gravida, Strain GMp14c1" /LENGTH=349 /DNA_ID=CAMNT_0048076857 /DNA_START=24 /DNA_END=1073 /DNA_ORIENTATION=+
MEARRSTVDALLERETRQTSTARGDVMVSNGSPSCLNAVWRQKVIHWYFTLVSALRRQHSAAAESSSEDIRNPFNRASVHVTASLLDSYLMSLPTERALRYKHDRPAYQLLATTCLLLGMRLSQHDQTKEARQQQREAAAERRQGDDKHQGCGLKRAKTHRTNMNQVSVPTTVAGVAIPNAATILRISAAPKSISERHVLSMVREVTSSRSFPRSKMVTSLDFIQVFGASSTEVSEDGSSISLGPVDMEEASRLADVSVRSASFSGCRPSIVASAVITLVLARSNSVNMDMASIRQAVQRSIFGTDDAVLLASIRRAESNLLTSVQVRMPPSRNRHVVPTTHLIPLEDE